MENINKIEEALSIVWELGEDKIVARDAIAKKIFDKVGEDYLVKLSGEGYLTEKNNEMAFTDKGYAMARDVIRRQRLAERLLIDVLELDRGSMDLSACELEHILSREMEEAICTLLGHPKECPHALPIPPGDCCVKSKDRVESIVVPITKLAPGEVGKVVYVLTHKHPLLHKLMSLGIVPGVALTVHQIFPAFVIKVEETQVALEKEIAREIYVKRFQTS